MIKSLLNVLQPRDLPVTPQKIKKNDDYAINIGGMEVPVCSEVFQTIVAGVDGTGKSKFIRKYLEKALYRGQIGLCLDFQGEHSSELARECDLVVDAEGLDYSPLAEMQTESDACMIAQMIVPNDVEELSLLADVIGQLWSEHSRGKKVTNTTFIEMVENLRKDGCGSKALKDLITHLKSLQPDSGFHSFSVRKWFSESIKQSTKPFLWVRTTPHQKSSDKYIATLIAEFYLKEVCDLEAESEVDHRKQRRCWFVIDELFQYPAFHSPLLIQALTKGREKGLATIVSLYTPLHFQKIYGSTTGKIILSCFNNTVLFKQDLSLSRYWANYFGGDAVVRRTMEGSSFTYLVESKINVDRLIGLKALNAVCSYYLGDREEWSYATIPI